MQIMHEESAIHSYEKHLITENAKYWKDDPEIQENDRWIYVFHMRGPFEYSLFEDIVAKGFQSREAMPIASITDGELIGSFDELDASFGIKERYRIFRRKYVGLVSRLRTFWAAKFFSFTTYQNKKRLIGLKYRGVPCGDAIYDEIIRYDVNGMFYTQDKYVFDCFDIDRKTYFQYIRNALCFVDQSFHIFKARKPGYFLITEPVFLKSICGNVARHMGAKLIRVDALRGKASVQVSHQGKLFLGDCLKCQAEDSLKKHPQDEAELSKPGDLFVLKNTAALQTAAFQKTDGRKNVFIMLHGLSDAPRETYRHTVYHDYNEWFLDTLRIIKTIPDVNWIIKDHPLSYSYRQANYVRSVFEKYKTPNMYWCDRETSGMEIKQIADCVVTCAGECALEYWAYGIPTITVSEGYSVGWGISYNMKTRAEYEYALNHMGELQKPPEPSVKKAREYLLAQERGKDALDDLAFLFHKTFTTKSQSILRFSNIDTFPMNDSFCKEYIELLKKDGVRSSSVYQLKGLLELS